MIYKKYGETFLKLRKQKGFNLIYFEQLGISKSSLGKFERGESMLGFDKLTTALQVLSVTLGEYENLLNDFELGYTRTINSKNHNYSRLESTSKNVGIISRSRKSMKYISL